MKKILLPILASTILSTSALAGNDISLPSNNIQHIEEIDYELLERMEIKRYHKPSIEYMSRHDIPGKRIPLPEEFQEKIDTLTDFLQENFVPNKNNSISVLLRDGDFEKINFETLEWHEYLNVIESENIIIDYDPAKGKKTLYINANQMGITDYNCDGLSSRDDIHFFNVKTGLISKGIGEEWLEEANHEIYFPILEKLVDAMLQD